MCRADLKEIDHRFAPALPVCFACRKQAEEHADSFGGTRPERVQRMWDWYYRQLRLT